MTHSPSRELLHLGKFSRPFRWVRFGYEARKKTSERRSELQRFRRTTERFHITEQLELDNSEALDAIDAECESLDAEYYRDDVLKFMEARAS